MTPPSWEKWWEMAQDALASAQLLQRHGQFRASASRSYYACYQSVTAVLLYQKQTPPDNREAWSHELTLEFIRKQLTLIRAQEQRNDLAARLRRLYTLRISADYAGRGEVEEAALTSALRDASYLVKTAGVILPTSKTGN